MKINLTHLPESSSRAWNFVPQNGPPKNTPFWEKLFDGFLMFDASWCFPVSFLGVHCHLSAEDWEWWLVEYFSFCLATTPIRTHPWKTSDSLLISRCSSRFLKMIPWNWNYKGLTKVLQSFAEGIFRGGLARLWIWSCSNEIQLAKLWPSFFPSLGSPPWPLALAVGGILLNESCLVWHL